VTEVQPTRAQVAFRQMAALDPDLAAKLVLMSLPVAARRINGEVTYDLTVHGWGTYRVSKQNGGASVEEYPSGPMSTVPIRESTST